MALNDVEITGMSMQAAAKKWHVKRTTLYDLKANPNHSFHSPTVTLTEAEEEKLLFWMHESARRGYPRTRSDVLEGAYRLIVLRKGDDAKVPSNCWLDGFIKRHELSLRKARRLGEASARVSKADVVNWLIKVHQLMIDEGFEGILQDPKRIYNADETFFVLSPDRGRALVKKGMKNSLIVFPGMRLSTSIRASAAPSEVDMAVSESGWMNGGVFCLFPRSVAQQAIVDMPSEKALQSETMV